MQGIVIAGTHSGCGKTTVTLGILAALREKGLEVQAFKTGPDFIDAGLHRLITGRPSRNLDIWMCGQDYVIDCFGRYAADADITVVEGVMGMYDGDSSTALLAQLLGLPVLLVVDAYGMAESAGAVVKGFISYDAETRRYSDMEKTTLRSGELTDLPMHRSSDSPAPGIAGVIFNRVASESHYARLKESVKDIPVLGYLPRDLQFEIPHRHLGLTVAEESPLAKEDIEKLADAVSEYIDIDKLLASTKRGTGAPEKKRKASSSMHRFSRPPRVAIAYDKAFCFYYEDNLDALREGGAEVVPFSPLSDDRLPEHIDALYIGGGYPELYAGELSKHASMLHRINDWIQAGKPVYAECGGLMYLSQGIYDFTGTFFPMVGAFPFETEMKKGRSRLGYREVLLEEDCILGAKGETCRGHEFHYSQIKDGYRKPEAKSRRTDKEKSLNSGLCTLTSDMGTIYSVRDKSGQPLLSEGYRTKRALASYIHVHFGSNSGIARNFVHYIREI
ncbi:MAG: cobyrinate a,c-diamide synthase [Nitrospirota bacterium]